MRWLKSRFRWPKWLYDRGGNEAETAETGTEVVMTGEAGNKAAEIQKIQRIERETGKIGRGKTKTDKKAIRTDKRETGTDKIAVRTDKRETGTDKIAIRTGKRETGTDKIARGRDKTGTDQTGTKAFATGDKKMVIIAGLGNPTREYENTRHNIGFMAVDALADKYNIHVMDCKHKALLGKGMIGGTKVVLMKPLTYMNLSGEAIRAVVNYYKVDAESELIVIYDDISLDVGQLRIRKKGSAGGHNGIKNIIANLGSDTFLRIKIGVGEKPKGYDLADYVLGHFDKEEQAVMAESLAKVDGAVNLMLEGRVDMAMNQYNVKNSPKEATQTT